MRKVYNFIALIIGILAFLVLGELISGFYFVHINSAQYLKISENPILVYEHKPSIEFINRHGIKVKYNSLGLIGGDIKQEDNSIKILGIGDSIAAATYLPEDERYLNILSRLLEQRLKLKAQVLNAGVGGYNSYQQLELLKRKITFIKPDLIIAGICMNDFVNVYPAAHYIFGKTALFLRDGSKARYFDFLYQRSNLYKLVYDKLSGLRRTNMVKKDYTTYLLNYNFSVNGEEWQNWLTVLKQMVEVATQADADIIFVLFPLESQLIQKNGDAYTKKFLEFAAKNNLHFVNLSDIYRLLYSQETPLYVKYDLIHPNKLGHSIAAKEIFEYMEKDARHLLNF